MIKCERWSGGIDEEYETQHFGFGAQRFKIAVRQMVQEKISTCVKDMQNYLQDALDLNETDKVTLTHSCSQLIRLYCERAGPSLEAIDDELNNVINIPSNVLLSSDEVQVEQTTEEEYEKLKNEVANLRKSIKRGALMEALLSAEEKEIAHVDKTFEMAKKDMEVLDLLQKNLQGTQYLKDMIYTTQNLVSSAPFMKELDSDSDDADN